MPCEPHLIAESRNEAGGSDGEALGRQHRDRGVTIDRRLRSGEAPDGALLAIWLLTAGCIAFAASTWPSPDAASGIMARTLPILASCAALAATMLGLARTAWRLLGREACVATCLLLPLNPLVLAAYLPQADGALAWQMAAGALAVWSLSARHAGWGTLLAGCAMGAGCALGPTLWPVAATMGVLLFARWLGDHRASGGFTGYLKSFAAVSLPVALGQEVIFGRLACGTSGLALPAAMTALLAGAVGLERIPRLAPAMLAGGMSIIVAAALGVAASLPLACGQTPFASLAAGPAISGTSGFALALPPVVLGLGASLYLWRGSGEWLRRWWSDYAWILATAGIGGIVVPGLLAVAMCLAAMPLGWLAAQLLYGHKRGGSRRWWPASLAAILVIGSAAFAVTHTMPEQGTEGVVIAYADNVPR